MLARPDRSWQAKPRWSGPVTDEVPRSFSGVRAAQRNLRPHTQTSQLPSISRQERVMAKYLISFPSAAMVVPDGEWEAVVHDSHVVIEEAKAAGVYVFGGGIDEN